MKNAKLYKEKLSNADDPRYTFEHYNGYSFYPTYSMTTEDMRNLRNENKGLAKAFKTEKISDRAIVIYDNYNTKTLKSYHTYICEIDNNGNFTKLWDGYSATTMKHINIFRQMFGLPTMSKYEWIMTEIPEEIM